MKAYLLTTGALFLLLTVIHVVRLAGERHLARDPWFLAVTVLALAFAAWAWRLYRRAGNNAG